MDRRWLTLLQLCDSNFPSGAFSHSFGMETYIQDGGIHDRRSFVHWLQAHLHHSVVPADGLAFRLVYEALAAGEQEVVWEYDHLLYVQGVPRETREGNRKMGERMLQLGMSLFDSHLLSAYKQRMEKRHQYGHPAIVFAVIAYELGVEKETALGAYLYSSLAALVQNGVRGIPLGQTDGQRILLDLQTDLLQAAETIQGLGEADFGTVPPGLELAQMRHERLSYRLFMS